MSNRINRWTFLKALAGCSIAAASTPLWWQLIAKGKQIPCRLLGPSVAVGHRLRDGMSIPSTTEIVNKSVVIVGGGIAGLSAGWWLKRNGFNDFAILELESEVGGNSRSGKNQISEYPWGAHYVPLANGEAEYVRQFFEDIKVIEGYDHNGLPIYCDLYLCAEPQERLFKDGAFQEGLVPHRGLQPTDKEQVARFFALVKKLRHAVGSDGKPAFAIPLDLSSADEDYRNLDTSTFADWLAANNFDSRPLLWYLNYCCRDDYGATLDRTSTWAGLHYFAGRRGTAANAEMNAVVTWPQGNGFLVQKLRERLSEHLETNKAVVRIIDNRVSVDCAVLDTTNQNWQTFSAKQLVFAAPRFLAPHVISGYPTDKAAEAHTIQYAPWLVANISLSKAPAGRGAPLAWDNVSYSGDSLGYVVATHQNISTRPDKTVITYYRPLSDKQPSAARHALLSASAEQLQEQIVSDLENMHAGIRNDIMQIDAWTWGHGMVSPSVGFIWSANRQKMKERLGNILFAHSDMSGMSNFEEAQYHGVEAAKSLLASV